MTETLVLGFSSALIMGLVFGAGPCNITCLPYLGPVFLSQQNSSPKTSWRTIIPFSLGRLTGYTILGAVAGGLGLSVTKLIEEGIALQLLGLATLIAGLYLLLSGSAKKLKSCNHKQTNTSTAVVNFNSKNTKSSNRKPAWYLSLSLFTMGTGMALNPCVPLMTILSVAATMANPGDGAKLGIAFGIGAVIIPGIFFGLAIAFFSQQVKVHLEQWGRTLEKLSAYMLICLGILTTLGWVQP